ncbi:MAG: phosphoenolpyruvate--protein phosphotransferase [Desulfobacteraceae bacterium]|nr:phosphoenolpyruvate--protein phosphotransferase [Desulfobacteraceae bacterium]MBC2755986.1 phosphoenolpyruvate--protein phosphotransferase [Desulfobacteraceae bacterium]
MPSDTTEKIIKGISGSPGICIGKAYLVDKEGVDVIEKYSITENKVKKEINRFKSAVTKAKNELSDIIKGVPEELRQHAAILETHLLLHKDKMLYGKAIDIITNELINAEWALKEATSQAKSMFSNIADPYLKSRSADIEHVSERIMRNLVGCKDVNISNIDKRVILVAHTLSPAETSQIQLEKIMGFITDRGGKASHTSIIARTLEIPAVLGLDNATQVIKNDSIIIVDGSEGIVIVDPEEETLIKYDELSKKYETRKANILRTSDRPAKSADGHLFSIMGNIELPEEVVAVKDHGGEGIGLFRTEFLYLGRMSFPDEQELFDQYKEVAELMAPNPVIIRTLDINGDKAISAIPTPEESNPSLGLRAIRFCLKNPDIFITQLRAILRSAAFGNVKLLLPMISGCEEILQTFKIIDEAAESLEKDGLAYNRNIQIGIMIEIPSAAIMADAMADLVDFFSIGTNDLVQYTLAIDRVNRHVAYLYNPLHPAVIRMIKHVVDTGKKKDIKTFMCGEMASEIINLPVLLGLGLDAFSMAPQSIPSIKNMIRKISVNESKLFLKKVMKQTSALDTIQLITDTYGETLANGIYDK